MNQDRLLTLDEAAEILKVKPRTVRYWIYSGKLNQVKLSHKVVRIRESELNEFIRNESQKSS